MREFESFLKMLQPAVNVYTLCGKAVCIIRHCGDILCTLEERETEEPIQGGDGYGGRKYRAEQSHAPTPFERDKL